MQNYFRHLGFFFLLIQITSESKSVTPFTFKKVFLIGKTSDKFAYDLDSVLKDKNYIQYLSSYNFIGIMQFIILTIIVSIQSYVLMVVMYMME